MSGTIIILQIIVCPFILFLLTIVLSVFLRFTDSDYPFVICKLLVFFVTKTDTLKYLFVSDIDIVKQLFVSETDTCMSKILICLIYRFIASYMSQKRIY